MAGKRESTAVRGDAARRAGCVCGLCGAKDGNCTRRRESWRAGNAKMCGERASALLFLPIPWTKFPSPKGWTLSSPPRRPRKCAPLASFVVPLYNGAVKQGPHLPAAGPQFPREAWRHEARACSFFSSSVRCCRGGNHFTDSSRLRAFSHCVSRSSHRSPRCSVVHACKDPAGAR